MDGFEHLQCTMIILIYYFQLCLVSTQANTSWVRPFLFRNYVFPVRSASHFAGSTQSHMWEAVRASAAAPGYFSEYNIGDLALLVSIIEWC